MSLLEAIILGIIQGLTEFIPVSSSGHLVLAHTLIGDDGGLVFDVALHGGTLLALVIFFHRDLFRLIKSFFSKSKDAKLAKLLILATIPAVIFGVALESYVESTFRSTKLVAFNLIFVALLMLLVERYSQKLSQKTKLEDTSLKQALAVGFAQAAAIIPGVSRSGSTITTGLLMGMDRVAATRFAFLLGIPIMFGALLKTIADNALTGFGGELDIFVVGVLSAFVSGMVAIKFLLKFLGRHSLDLFAYYRIGLGILVLALAL